MSGRELVILLLGSAIVAVVLRGLYVAFRTRRSQIKLAIDKNIPTDVDLDALELAELPGGGARIVGRSLDQANQQDSALDLAESKAKALQLADEDDENHIPVLMDAVELSEVRPDIRQDARVEVHEGENAEFTGDETNNVVTELDEQLNKALEVDAPQNYSEHGLGEDREEALAESGGLTQEVEFKVESKVESDVTPVISGQGFEDEHEHGEQRFEVQYEHREQGEEDPDTALLDYEENEEPGKAFDALSSVVPDYIDDNKTVGETEQDDSGEEEGIINQFEDQNETEPYYNENESKEQTYEEAEDGETEEKQIYEETEDEELETHFDPENNMDEFPMTAGERIGYNTSPVAAGEQSKSFEELEEDEIKTKKSRSLLSLFSRKSAKKEDQAHSDLGVDSEVSAQMAAVKTKEPNRVEEFEQDISEPQEDQRSEKGWSEKEGLKEVVSQLEKLRSTTQTEGLEQTKAQPTGLAHSEVLVINITAKQGRVFAGDDLLHCLITSGLKFGDTNIFHKRLSKENKSPVIFSVANMLNPGTFDLNNVDKFTTLGIIFFLALPTSINNLDAFEQMLDVAQAIRDTLDGELKDDHRNGITAQTIEHYRQRIRDFELRRLKAVTAKG